MYYVHKNESGVITYFCVIAIPINVYIADSTRLSVDYPLAFTALK